MTNTERAELRALAELLDRWPQRIGDHFAVGFSGDAMAVVDAQLKDDYSLYVHSPVTL